VKRLVFLIAAIAQPGLATPPIFGSDAPACQQGAAGPAILILPEGLRDRKGQLRVELYPDDADGFLQDDKILIESGRTFRRIDIPTPPSGPIGLCIRVPHPGRYSLMLLHDRDSNRKFGVFVDGAGLPGNPKLGLHRPRVEQALIAVGGGVTVAPIILNYWRGFGFRPIRGK
jgi:uncharacterized protein (DUF2141 family)